MKKIMFVGFMVGIYVLFFVGSTFACGERDVVLVDNIEESETTMSKSRCSKVFVPINKENNVVVERSEIKITEHQAKHILEDYLEQEYRGKLRFSIAANTEIPGHESHTHGHGRLQDTHGTISYSFLVDGKDFYDGKAFPMYVDAKTGTAYGVGCGFGAGPAVFTPDLSKYPDTDNSDTAYHQHGSSSQQNMKLEKVEFNFFESIAGFFLGLFGF